MLSVCVITKNERENLEKCLSLLNQYPVEIVVVDTGSEDDSVSVAKKYTDSVYHFEWCDDFSAARNFAMEQAKYDMVMMLDTDEFIEEWDMDSLSRLIQEQKGKVGRIHRRNEYVTEGLGMNSNELVNRIFDRRLFCYEGVVHEQIVARNGEVYETYPAPVFTSHSGYVGGSKEREKKAQRNLTLLFQMLEKNENDAYILYQIGKSYYYKKDYVQAVEYFGRAIEQPVDERLEYVVDLVTSYGYAWLNAGHPEQALPLENVYEDFCGSADFLFMLGNVYMQNGKFDQAVRMFLSATELPGCSVEGVNSYLAYYNVGVIYECLGMKTEAQQYYRKCGGYQLAQEGLERLK